MHIYLSTKNATVCGKDNTSEKIKDAKGFPWITEKGKIEVQTQLRTNHSCECVEIGGHLWSFVKSQDRYRNFRIIFKQRICKECYGLAKLSTL